MEDEIAVVDYDAAWPARYEEERRALEKAFRGRELAFEHIGSTAVPGLAAKPTIDLMVGAEPLEIGEAETAAMRSLGYDHYGEYGIPGRHFFRKGLPPTHHVHWVRRDADFWAKQLVFRDYLRSHRDDAAAYEKLKRGLAEKYHDDRASYTKSKTRFCLSLQERAWKWAGAELIVFDLEATCWDDGHSAERQEIIEIGAVRLGPDLRVTGKFERLVRPKDEPTLSDFCAKLTGIRQLDVDAARAFPDALAEFDAWCGDGLYRLASWSRYDLEQLRRDASRHGLALPPRLERHVDMQELYSVSRSCPTLTTHEALAQEGWPPLGRAHRGYDDACNVARLAAAVLEDLLPLPAPQGSC